MFVFFFSPSTISAISFLHTFLPITGYLCPILVSISHSVIRHLCFRSSHLSLLSPLLHFTYLLFFLFLQLGLSVFFSRFSCSSHLLLFNSIICLSLTFITTCYFFSFSSLWLNLSIYQLFILYLVSPLYSPLPILCLFSSFLLFLYFRPVFFLFIY